MEVLNIVKNYTSEKSKQNLKSKVEKNKNAKATKNTESEAKHRIYKVSEGETRRRNSRADEDKTRRRNSRADEGETRRRNSRADKGETRRRNSRADEGETRRKNSRANEDETSRRYNDRIGEEKSLVKTEKSLTKKKSKPFDLGLLITIFTLLALGLISVLSASAPSALASYGDSYYFFKSQLISAGIGIFIMFVASFFDYRNFKGKLSWLALIGSIGLLILVLVPRSRYNC